MELKRESGVLLHISSLPSVHGIGDFGVEAYRFVDQLVESGCSKWQILPLGPIGPGNSPYQAYSAFAGELMFISLQKLLEWDLILDSELSDVPSFSKRTVDYNKVRFYKSEILHLAYKRFVRKNDCDFQNEFETFKNEHNWWLGDYALYTACKNKFKGKAWNNWDTDLRKRNTESLNSFSLLLNEEIEFEKFVQFMFFRQWFLLKNYANQKGIQIFGDLPLYVSHDSSDVWGNQSIFILNDEGEPNLLGGVPPDYFSEEGQLWGNPVYDWNKLSETEYQWWISRLYFNFHLFNVVRIDHFRGLESFWAVPRGEETAKKGEWLPAKGHELLAILQERLVELPVIAEDLGDITPNVEKLRDTYKLPGMKVLQFAFTSDPSNVHLPHNYSGRNIVYTGTHDNNTLVGWLADLVGDEKRQAENYIKTKDKEAINEMVELAWASTAEMAIIPMQDILKLNGKSRMNTPGTIHKNWLWRYESNQLKAHHLNYLKVLNTKYNRINE
ncbi:MAG: 4-alpha-glucanotransferase [Prolixibacteraceae bacterium]|jgi:4-alpha-glucanotransferase|nr:4-alpha-glucanotransferase [Prolixibacteraceae bacterium]